MRLTCLKIKGQRATEKQTKTVAKQMQSALKKVGFITECTLLNQTAIRIGLHMHTFNVDIKRLGYNARLWSGITGNGEPIRCFTSIAPFKRTSLPTWEQRVKFNNILNDILDKAKATARIQSGPYIVRSVANGRCNENDWLNMTPNYQCIEAIQPLTEAMEVEAMELRRAHNRKQAKIRREKLKGKMVKVKMRYGDSVRNELIMSETEYQEYRLGLSTGDFHTHSVESIN